ncbi:cytidine deaminase [Actinomadura craniellae]|uniref:Cytidine deaminase n=1 Tax=Actinomadura craniellae TaxID=2231787 RepID=A0A365GZ22_9ACTN|nr:cytidine deaminase [Actinomadura craniellae]RAY12061.1 cytidine deaminase [Actinomadura craniellae]
MSEIIAEDAKIITLARAARARTGALEGAAVRDTMGRTYSATTVDLPSLKLSALRLAVAVAAASGAEGLEAAALVTTTGTAAEIDVAAVHDLGGQAPILVAAPDGTLRATL